MLAAQVFITVIAFPTNTRSFLGVFHWNNNSNYGFFLFRASLFHVCSHDIVNDEKYINEIPSNNLPHANTYLYSHSRLLSAQYDKQTNSVARYCNKWRVKINPWQVSLINGRWTCQQNLVVTINDRFG